MIVLINGENKSKHANLIEKMHKLRKEIFNDQLGWKVNVSGDWEIDHYDALHPLYVLSVDEENNIRGALRLLPTTGLNMLNDTFPELLPDGKRIESPLIGNRAASPFRRQATVAGILRA